MARAKAKPVEDYEPELRLTLNEAQAQELAQGIVGDYVRTHCSMFIQACSPGPNGFMALFDEGGHLDRVTTKEKTA
jgi:hypothetical protein